MRIRGGIVVVLLIVGVTSCTSKHTATPNTSTGGSSAGQSSTGALRTTGIAVTPATPFCARLIAASPKITTAQTALYSGKNGDAAVAAIITELTALQQDAPTGVRNALADMITQFQSARDAVQRPTMQDRDKIAVFGAHISTDNQQIAAYVRANCTAG